MFSTLKKRQRTPARHRMACGMVAGILGAAGIATAAGQTPNTPESLGFDSRLWQSIYHPDPQESQIGATATGASHSTIAPIPTQNSLLMMGAQRVGAASLAEATVNDRSSENRLETPEASLSDWERLKLGSIGSHSSTAANGGGPTPTTILVGFTAAVVVCGALFSGNQ